MTLPSLKPAMVKKQWPLYSLGALLEAESTRTSLILLALI
jgi:hypothetical protein